jgi:hypothetical protein
MTGQVASRSNDLSGWHGAAAPARAYGLVSSVSALVSLIHQSKLQRQSSDNTPAVGTPLEIVRPG